MLDLASAYLPPDNVSVAQVFLEPGMWPAASTPAAVGALVRVAALLAGTGLTVVGGIQGSRETRGRTG
jgi:hypothetical protein